ncbi:hypothetical protein [uncultured Mediterranean phage uvDeep-CGR2-KM21-C88]|nr:hypothetical protein [uncultured Mediterranean phage uvDeep-CGR2-KM21-C88]
MNRNYSDDFRGFTSVDDFGDYVADVRASRDDDVLFDPYVGKRSSEARASNEDKILAEIDELIENRPEVQRRRKWVGVLDEDGNPVFDSDGEPKQRYVIQKRVKIGEDDDGNTIWDEWADEEGYDYTDQSQSVDEIRDRIDDFRDIRGELDPGADGILGTADDIWVGGIDDERRDLDKLIDAIEGTGGAVDREEAERVAARMLGFTTTAGGDGILGTEDDVSAYANYQAYQQKLMGQEAGMIGGTFDALGAEERARREGRLERHLQRMDESYAHMLGGIMAETGSSARYLMAADEAIRNQNELIEGFEESLNTAEDLARKQAWEEVRGAYEFAVGANREIQKDVIDQLYSSRVAAAQEQARKVGLMVQQYSAEADALSKWADNQFKAMEMDLGLEEHIMEQMDAAYERDLRPWQVELSALGDQLVAASAAATISLTKAQEAALDADPEPGTPGAVDDPGTPYDESKPQSVQDAETAIGTTLVGTGGAIMLGGLLATPIGWVAAGVGALVASVGSLIAFWDR